MELRHLRSFVVLAEERHFGRAAARLHIAQPALSQQLRQLEREVGGALMDRSTRRVELTEAGRLLQRRAVEIVAAVDRTSTDLGLLAAGRAGLVRVGFVGTATYDVLPRVALRVRDELPEVELELRGELLGPALLEGLLTGDLDVAVLRPGPVLPEGLEVVELRTEPLVAVLPADHPMAGAAEVPLSELGATSVITHPSGHRSTMQPSCSTPSVVPASTPGSSRSGRRRPSSCSSPPGSASVSSPRPYGRCGSTESPTSRWRVSR